MATPQGTEAVDAAENAAATFTSAAKTPLDGHTGIDTATNAAGEHAALSSTANVDLAALNSAGQAASPGHIDTIILTGSADLNGTGDQHDNLIVGNDGNNHLHAGDGNDTVLSGNGDDMIMLQDGDDTAIINGSGTKTVNGGAGDDHFVVIGQDGSDTTFTGLNIGDRLTVKVADANSDGILSFDDVTLSATGNGSVMYTLSDGTSFTLDGVSVAAAIPNADNPNGINYSASDNGDGTWTVDITG